MSNDQGLHDAGANHHGDPAVLSGRQLRMPPAIPGDPLIAREQELAWIQHAFDAPDIRTVSIVGPGGVGKTRLSLSAAHALAERYADGVVFLRLDQVARQSLWEAIGRQMAIMPPAGGDWRDVVSPTLAWRQMLLVLDNCESLPEALDAVPDLLDVSPGVDVLATSREALRLPGERELWLQPLDVPVESTSLDTLIDNPAVHLFSMRARDVDPSFTVHEGNMEPIGRIVRRLDGLPLALELAAAYLRHLSPSELLAMLDSAMPELGGGTRNLPERHRSLRTLVGWSLDMLPDHLRSAMIRMAIFPGTFTPDTVATVLDSPSARQGWSALLALADRSLVVRAPSRDTGETTFSMLQTVRSVAREELESTPGLLEETLVRRARALADLARDADRHYHGPEGIEWLRRMRQHAGDARMIVDESERHAALRDLAIRISGDMFWYWYTQGDYHWALPRIESLLETPGTNASDNDRARAHVTAGWFSQRMGQIERAEHHFVAARRLFGSTIDRGSLLAGIGYAYVFTFDRRDIPYAIELMEEVTKLAPGVENAWHEQAAGHFGIALTRYYEGDIATARQHLVETVRLGRAHSDAQTIGMSLMYLAHVDRAEGSPVEAFWKLREALPLLMEIGDIATTALLLDIVTSTLTELGNHDLAADAFGLSEYLRTTMGAPRSPLEQPEMDDLRTRLEEVTGDAVRMDRATDLEGTIDRLLRYHPEPESAERASISAPGLLLSPRELEVLHLIARGMTAPEIAEALYISRHTVKRHMANIREKLGVRSQAAAVAALRNAS